MDDGRILKIAEAVRYSAEKLVRDGDYGMSCWEDLEGCCGDVSIVLARILGEKTVKIQSGRFEGKNHVWVRIKKTGFILDLTATQFGDFPKVFHVPPFTENSAKFCVFGDLTISKAERGWGDEEWRGRLEKGARKLLREERK